MKCFMKIPHFSKLKTFPRQNFPDNTIRRCPNDEILANIFVVILRKNSQISQVIIDD